MYHTDFTYEATERILALEKQVKRLEQQLVDFAPYTNALFELIDALKVTAWAKDNTLLASLLTNITQSSLAYPHGLHAREFATAEYEATQLEPEASDAAADSPEWEALRQIAADYIGPDDLARTQCICDFCQGNGTYINKLGIKIVCWKCHGTGEVRKVESS